MTELGNIDELRRDVSDVLLDAISCGIFPGAVAAIVSPSDELVVACGRAVYCQDAPEVKAESIFDVASLTKVVATSMAIMHLRDSGKLSIDDLACNYIPQLAHGNKSRITIAHLLAHMAGFPGDAPLYKKYKTKDEFIDAAISLEIDFPPGTGRLYDDISYIILGHIIEIISRTPLNVYCHENIFKVLGMKDTMFCPQNNILNRVIPTEIDFSRGGLLHGVVHDENANILGGVSGNAGLFSTAHDLGIFSRVIMGHTSDSCIVSRESIRLMLSPVWNDINGDYRLCFDGNNRRYMNCAGNIVGHTGFTGTSIVVDLDANISAILLSNRVHPHRVGREPIDTVRRRFSEVVFQRFGHVN